MGGGWGGPGLMARKQPGQQWFFLSSTYYLSVYRGGPMLLLQRKLYIFQAPEGVQDFPGGSTFSRGGGGGGGPMLISIETHITCDFQTPYPPLWIPNVLVASNSDGSVLSLNNGLEEVRIC